MPTGEVFMYGWIISWIRLIPRPFQVYLESLTNCRNSRWSSQSNDLNHLKNQPCCFASISFFVILFLLVDLMIITAEKRGCWTYEGERHFDGYRKRQLDVSEHLTGPQKRKIIQCAVKAKRVIIPMMETRKKIITWLSGSAKYYCAKPANWSDKNSFFVGCFIHFLKLGFSPFFSS